MRKLIAAMSLLVACQVWASGGDLKAVMKQMKVEFRHAAQASDVVEMQTAVGALTSLVEQAKQGEYPPEKVEVYQEGFQALSQALGEVQQSLEGGDLARAKTQLKRVDELRIEYHDQRNPSIWSKLFG